MIKSSTLYPKLASFEIVESLNSSRKSSAEIKVMKCRSIWRKYWTCSNFELAQSGSKQSYKLKDRLKETFFECFQMKIWNSKVLHQKSLCGVFVRAPISSKICFNAKTFQSRAKAMNCRRFLLQEQVERVIQNLGKPQLTSTKFF